MGLGHGSNTVALEAVEKDLSRTSREYTGRRNTPRYPATRVLILIYEAIAKVLLPCLELFCTSNLAWQRPSPDLFRSGSRIPDVPHQFGVRNLESAVQRATSTSPPYALPAYSLLPTPVRQEDPS